MSHKSNTSKNNDEFDYKNDTWILIKEYLNQYNRRELIRHHIDSFNNFMDVKINDIIKQQNPLVIYHEYNEQKNSYKNCTNNIFITFNISFISKLSRIKSNVKSNSMLCYTT